MASGYRKATKNVKLSYDSDTEFHEFCENFKFSVSN